MSADAIPAPSLRRSVYLCVNDVMNDVGAVGKDGEVTSGPARYKFRGIDAVVKAVGPALRAHGVICSPMVESYEYATVEVGSQRSRMASVRVTVRYRWFGPDGDSFDSVSVGEAFDSGDKATAKAMSVAFRTMLLQTLAIPTDEPDPDETTYERAGVIVTDAEWLASARRRLTEALGLAALEAIKAEVTRKYNNHEVSEQDYNDLGSVYGKAFSLLSVPPVGDQEALI